MDSYIDILQHVDLKLRYLGVSFLLVFTTVLLLYWRSIRKQSYWKKKGIPYVKPYPFFGSFLDYMRKPFQDVEVDRYNKYGSIYGYYEGNRAILSVAEPDMIRNILVKDFEAFPGGRRLKTGDKITDSILPMLQGDEWKRVRTILTPAFGIDKMEKMMSSFKDCSRTLVQNLEKASERGEPIDAKRTCAAFSMDIITSSVFSIKIDSHNEPNNKFITAAIEAFPKFVGWRIFILFLLPGIMKYFKTCSFSQKSIDFFSNVILETIEERKRPGQTKNDFLQYLLDSSEEMAQEGKLDIKDNDDISKNYGIEENNEIFKNYHSKKALSQDELVAHCVVFFLADYKKTSFTLSFLLYELAVNPDVQERVIQELDDTLMANDGELTYEAVQSMKYMDNVISETLRKYPLSIKLERTANKSYKLGDTGLTIPEGMLVSIPLYAIQKDPELFPDPEKFDPDRFTPEERTKRNPYTYFPFCAGPKTCIGMRFALTEIKVCLAHVLSNFKIKKCPETKVPLELHTDQGLLEPRSITLFMEVRDDAVKAL